MHGLVFAAALAATAVSGSQAQDVPPPAPPTTVAQFLREWPEMQNLKERVVPPRAAELARELGFSVQAWKEQVEADQKAGRPPRACPVKGTSDEFTSADIVTAFEAIPPDQRTMSLRDAMFAFLDERHPCA